jgi:putative ABC transport system substrate-binding protein
MRRREFVTLLSSVAAWPIAGRAQQSAMPVIGFIDAASDASSSEFAAAFGRGLGEAGYPDGQNVTIEYHWLDGRYDRLSALIADLVRRQVSVIATPGSTVAGAAA